MEIMLFKDIVEPQIASNLKSDLKTKAAPQIEL